MQTTNWVKRATQERYGSGEIYTFTHMEDARRWAGKMDWSFNKKLGSGKISIVTVMRPSDREFEIDANDPLAHAGAKGDWLKSQGSIHPEHFVSSETYSPKSKDII